ncbi:hypothetical protein Cni_G09073 [Canna indica]|uniref:Uncharacterized protein n=1 Tax=Canna indica TaxID=4628 RepID=A0AAQ3Q9A0_9LILI|nr:hypothetical protein Cni_G09073 [Canna indica]
MDEANEDCVGIQTEVCDAVSDQGRAAATRIGSQSRGRRGHCGGKHTTRGCEPPIRELSSSAPRSCRYRYY